MQARVKPDARYSAILALSGLEFIKAEWRAVPAGKEAEALRNQYLECRELVVEEVTDLDTELEAELADWDSLPDVEELPEEVIEKPKAKKLTPYIEELPAMEEHAGVEEDPTLETHAAIKEALEPTKKPNKRKR